MLYFFYDHLLDERTRSRVLAGARRPGGRPLHLPPLQRAVARHVRLQFHEFDPRYESAVADLTAQPGKFVYGGVADLAPAGLEVVEQHYADTRQRNLVRVSLLLPGEPEYRTAWTHQSTDIEWLGLTPSTEYVAKLTRGAIDIGSTEIWVRELLSLAPHTFDGQRAAELVTRR